ncbi:MAG: glycosyltransferase [Myxococcales bacterium]
MPRIKVIFNSRNVGVERSAFHGFLQARGDAVIPLACDLQDPPSLIPELVKKWEEGYQAVLAVKQSAGEAASMYLIRRLYYAVMNRLSEIPLQQNYYGFGLYDRVVVEALRRMGDPVPYFRGMVMEAGYRQAVVHFDQPARKRGKSSYNLFRLYGVAMLGLTSHSRVPLRLAAMIGFGMSGLSFLVGFVYLVYKLMYWDQFTLGLAPLLVAVFFLGSVQLFFTGVLGEYVGAIYSHVQHRPHAVEAERLNFDAAAPPRLVEGDRAPEALPTSGTLARK